MLKNTISRNFIYQSSKVRQLYTNLPKSNQGGEALNSREKAAEAVWARQMNEQELERLRGRLLEQQRSLQDTQNKLSELRDSLTNNSKGSK
ncbi:unnamed protein product [Mucor fragilis]